MHQGVWHGSGLQAEQVLIQGIHHEHQAVVHGCMERTGFQGFKAIHCPDLLPNAEVRSHVFQVQDKVNTEFKLGEIGPLCIGAIREWWPSVWALDALCTKNVHHKLHCNIRLACHVSSLPPTGPERCVHFYVAPALARAVIWLYIPLQQSQIILVDCTDLYSPESARDIHRNYASVFWDEPALPSSCQIQEIHDGMHVAVVVVLPWDGIPLCKACLNHGSCFRNCLRGVPSATGDRRMIDENQCLLRTALHDRQLHSCPLRRGAPRQWYACCCKVLQEESGCRNRVNGEEGAPPWAQLVWRLRSCIPCSAPNRGINLEQSDRALQVLTSLLTPPLSRWLTRCEDSAQGPTC
mmetsp:Transcript_130048/g.337270  ORF Transcript_130048/g.337270 Transcript_130048/m.337270 type:complete len:351 (+) Transcript_130048:142-1194(+)